MNPRILLAAALFCLTAGPAAAQTGSGFYLPVAPTSYGQDEFRAADGTTCRSSMDGTKRVEIGAFGSGGKQDDNAYSLPGYAYGNQGRNAGVYGRFSMSLDASPDRMNCNVLYRLEIERRQLELELMKRSLVDADRRLDDLKQSGAEDPAATATATRPAPAPKGADRSKVAKAPTKAATKPSKVAAVKQPAGGYPPP